MEVNFKQRRVAAETGFGPRSGRRKCEQGDSGLGKLLSLVFLELTKVYLNWKKKEATTKVYCKNTIGY